MASGDVVGLVLMDMPPDATRANPNIVAGGSTPAENWPVVDFDDTSDEYWDFLCALEGYGGGGLTLELPWLAAAATNNCVWGAAIRAIPDDTEDIETSHTYNFNTVTATAPSVVGEVAYDTITFTDGADMDSLADGERFMLRIQRDADNGSDSLVGDARLLWNGIVIRET